MVRAIALGGVPTEAPAERRLDVSVMVEQGRIQSVTPLGAQPTVISVSDESGQPWVKVVAGDGQTFWVPTWRYA